MKRNENLKKNEDDLKKNRTEDHLKKNKKKIKTTSKKEDNLKKIQIKWGRPQKKQKRHQ